MSKEIQKEIINKIKEFETVIILRHENPDPDALGSQGGLQSMLKDTFPKKNIFVSGDEVSDLTFINTMEKLSDETFQEALVIVCDTANIDRISDKRYNKGKFLIKIDHHPQEKEEDFYGDISWVDTKFSSASEMITELALNNKELFVLSAKTAQLLYTGIIGDTGRFLYNNVTPKTLHFASELLKLDFLPEDIYNPLYKTSPNIARLQGKVLLNYQVSEQGVAYFHMTKELMNEFDVERNSAANLVNVLANIEGNQIWALFVEDDNQIRVRIRSKKIKIDEVARQFKGGGHPLASGATVSDLEEATKLIEVLNQKVLDFSAN